MVEPYRVFQRLNYVTPATMAGASWKPGTVHIVIAGQHERDYNDPGDQEGSDHDLAETLEAP